MGELIGRYGRNGAKRRAGGSAMECGGKRGKYVRGGFEAEAMNGVVVQGRVELVGGCGYLGCLETVWLLTK